MVSCSCLCCCAFVCFARFGALNIYISASLWSADDTDVIYADNAYLQGRKYANRAIWLLQNLLPEGVEIPRGIVAENRLYISFSLMA